MLPRTGARLMPCCRGPRRSRLYCRIELYLARLPCLQILVVGW